MPTNTELVTIHKHDVIGMITINNPPVNALSAAVLDGIHAAFQQLRVDPAIRAMVLMGGGRTFSGGADIREFGKLASGDGTKPHGLVPLQMAMEASDKPIVVAIHGTAFGGGLELAMACHYRLATPTALVGQPEVKLGLIPGAGGTQRLPRLAGIPKAAEWCAIGDPISAAEAVQFGVVDQIVEEDLREAAIQFARNLAQEAKPPRRTCDLADRLGRPADHAAALGALRSAVSKRSRDLIAPMKAIDAVEAAASLPFAEGCQQEAAIFRECLLSDQSKALIHVFFSERGVSKIPGLPKEATVMPIRRAAVIGAGTMGGGITMAYANAGLPVLLKEVDQASLDRGLDKVKKNYESSVKRGRLTSAQMERRLALIEPVLTYDRFAEADIVVEAVFEGMQLKKNVFAELVAVTRPDAILATNTSTLDIDEIASATSRPQQVIGHHFFSPANVMRLLEMVRGKQSSPSVIATSMALARTLGKVGVLVGNCRGFVGNRMFEPYQREAQFLVEEGGAVADVDAALHRFGFAMGAMAVADLAGLDVIWRIRREYEHELPAGYRDPLVVDRLYERGRYGQKTGAGWYRYPDGRQPVPDPEVEQLIADCATKAGIRRRTISADEIVERTVYALVNEGAKILDEGFALRAADIDIVYIHGYGFPAHRGGPMWYADTVGIRHIYDRICQFERQHGPWWTPSRLLAELAGSGKTFADFDRERFAAA